MLIETWQLASKEAVSTDEGQIGTLQKNTELPPHSKTQSLSGWNDCRPAAALNNARSDGDIETAWNL